MNIDTKYLVRWGIPGWILIMITGPFIFFEFKDEIVKLSQEVNFIALGAFLTAIGVPLGYLLNQVHHSLSWVIPKYREWDKYFDKEIAVDEYFFKNEIGKMQKERYRYLLSRKHELGGLKVSLLFSLIIILIVSILTKFNWWEVLYFITVFIFYLLIHYSSKYSSMNVEKYFSYYLTKSMNSNKDD
ncbi:hypothetical protein WAK64_21440 [Bacillus spongiae]|uniref:Uncharacterized protein n=1 Tax=Bacillus spongiae TaxID=2683610 RepID=A0ABU8HJZ6_9BACI